MITYLAKRRFNFIDCVWISTASSEVSEGRFLTAAIVFVVGVVLSVACEIMAKRKAKGQS
jgi:hypothetical protein